VYGRVFSLLFELWVFVFGGCFGAITFFACFFVGDRTWEVLISGKAGVTCGSNAFDGKGGWGVGRMSIVAVEDGCPEDSCRHTKGITTAGKNQNKLRISKPWKIY